MRPTEIGEQQGEIVTDNNQQAELPPLDADIQERIGRISSLDKTELTNLSEEVLDCRERQLLQALCDLAAAREQIAAMKRGPEFYAYTGLISDVRLERMIDETRWWKTPGDEVYEVVRELKESRSKIARLETEKAQAETKGFNDGVEAALDLARPQIGIRLIFQIADLKRAPTPPEGPIQQEQTR